MKVCHLSTSKDGGAGIAALRLSNALNDQVSSFLLSCDDFELNLFHTFFRKLKEKRNSLALQKLALVNDYECLSFDGSYPNSVIQNAFVNDIINLHWVASFLDYQSFFGNTDLPPVVWTLHDMNPFLGLTHYEEDTVKLREEIRGGRSFESYSSKDLDYRTWSLKRDVFNSLSTEKLHIVSPSQWLAEKAKNSILSKFSISIIPNGIDTELFSKRSRLKSLSKFNIPNDGKKNLLFVSDSLENKRKGIEVLLEALKKLKDSEKYRILIMGKSLKGVDKSLDVQILGYISDDRLKSYVYSSADLFIIPSREDNLPNTVLESLACGTAVIGSSVGGIPEMVRPNVTGDLFEVGNVKELAGKIEAWFKRDDLEQISRQCREIAVNEYDVSLQAQRYKELYENILEAQK